MSEYDWRPEMYMLAREDPWCAECLARMTELEDAFLQIRAKLNPKDQAVLDAYNDACEEASYSLIYPACRIGRHSARLGDKTGDN